MQEGNPVQSQKGEHYSSYSHSFLFYTLHPLSSWAGRDHSPKAANADQLPHIYPAHTTDYLALSKMICHNWSLALAYSLKIIYRISNYAGFRYPTCDIDHPPAA
jgi:hypothetical protein